MDLLSLKSVKKPIHAEARDGDRDDSGGGRGFDSDVSASWQEFSIAVGGEGDWIRSDKWCGFFNGGEREKGGEGFNGGGA